MLECFNVAALMARSIEWFLVSLPSREDREDVKFSVGRGYALTVMGRIMTL